MNEYVIAYDVGTTGIKTCLFQIGQTIRLIGSSMQEYSLKMIKNTGVEQNPDDWWHAMCKTTNDVMCSSKISKDDIRGISFCAQMQGLVLVDKDGNPVRNAMSYMDSRADKELSNGLKKGFKVAGMNAYKLFNSIRISGAVAASVKDPVWKYKWVENNEPDVFKKIHKWLDVKEFLICKCTGEFVMTEDSAFATMLFDTRSNKKCFSDKICSMLGVNTQHLPKVIKSTDMVAGLSSDAAKELGLKEGTPVFGGGGDASLIGVGAGVVKECDTHIYMGTSGWVSTVVSKRTIDINHMIASIVGASDLYYNYFAELETAGKCLEWVKNHLALDEINVYLNQKMAFETNEDRYKSLYDYMMEAIKFVPAGSNGVIFTPWLHGNRCPFEDPNARGMFFNISLETGKTEMIHAVLEGVCYHLRWQLEATDKKINTSRQVRLVGGGALAPLTCQILSDVLGREVQTVENPQNVGAVGAAVLMAVGLGIIDNVHSAKKLIEVKERYIPNKENVVVYNKYYEVFKLLYKNNKKLFKMLNE